MSCVTPETFAGKSATSCLTFDRMFGSGFGEVSDTLKDLMVLLQAQNVSDDVRENLQIVLAEVMNNISEHAYGEERPGAISLQVAVKPCCIACRITDTGKSMPGLELPKGVLPDHDVEFEALPEGGFGWFLIRR